MKIQCACGSKYAFDVTPDMVRNPVRLVCQNCGADNSTLVNQLIQQQFATAAVPVVAVPGVSVGTIGSAKPAPAPEIAPPPPGARLVPLTAEAPSPASPAAHVSSPAPVAPSLRVSAAHAPAPAAESEAKPASTSEAPPMAPRYPVPRKQHLNSGEDKWLGRGLAAVFALFFAGLGFWAWYAWVGSVPKAYASLRFDVLAQSGQLHVQPEDQVVFLHGSRLVRHDFKAGKELWSVQLVDEKLIEQRSKEEYDRYVLERDKALRSGAEWGANIVGLEDVTELNKRRAADSLHLHARGEAVWISSTNKLSRYDWQSGRVTSEIDIIPGDNQFVANGDELLVRMGHQAVLTLNLFSGESKTLKSTSESAPDPGKTSTSRSGNTVAASSGQPLATNTVAGRASGSRRPVGTINRLAAPAVNAANDNQQRLGAELAGNSGTATTAPARTTANRPSTGPGVTTKASTDPGDTQLIATRRGVFQLTSKLLGQRTLNGENTVAYGAAFIRLGAADSSAWTGEMPGIADVYALPSVTILSAGRTVVALDANGKKLWQQKLETGLPVAGKVAFIPENPLRGEGPCVEHGGVIYLAESSGLTAVDATSGTQKWRAPCESPSTMVFDDHGDIYANIVVSGGEKAEAGVQKIEAATGKPLWRIGREGAATYASGKFLYTIDTYRGDANGKEGVESIRTILEVGPYIRLRRIDMETGKIKWSHVQERFPLDVRIEKNTFQLIFKKEVQLLKFVAL